MGIRGLWPLPRRQISDHFPPFLVGVLGSGCGPRRGAAGLYIIAAVQKVATGLAMPLPVMSKAEPWIGSNIVSRNSGARKAQQHRGRIPLRVDVRGRRDAERASQCRRQVGQQSRSFCSKRRCSYCTVTGVKPAPSITAIRASGGQKSRKSRSSGSPVCRYRVGDPRLISLIRRWLKAGVLEDGAVHPSEQGTPQGGSISVLLSNLYLHYVLDLWFVSAL
jgi:hypothetical protein